MAKALILMVRMRWVLLSHFGPFHDLVSRGFLTILARLRWLLLLINLGKKKEKKNSTLFSPKFASFLVCFLLLFVEEEDVCACNMKLQQIFFRKMIFSFCFFFLFFIFLQKTKQKWFYLNNLKIRARNKNKLNNK